MSYENCYRVRMKRGSVVIEPVIAARDKEHAFEKAQVLAEDLLHPQLPWIYRRDGGKLPPEDNSVTVIDKPVLKCLANEHHNGVRKVVFEL